jgi:predicted dehydrogenase
MAVIGVGHLGRAHARILAGLPEVELVGVADVDAEQARAVAQQCGTWAYDDYRALLEKVEAACVVVPTEHHFAVANAFIRQGVHVLVEKPLAPTLAQADELVRNADEHEVILQVGHIERFNPAFEEVQSRPIAPKFIECERHGPYTGRSTDIGAVLDLMIHDLDLLLTLVGGPVVQVQACGAAVFGGHEDIVNARLAFANGAVATLTASRMSPKPKRRMRLWAPEGYAGIDFIQRRVTLVQPSDELRANGLDLGRLDPTLRSVLQHEVFGRHLQTLHLHCEQSDQLTSELQHFLRCVQSGVQPRVPGSAGRNAIALAERILECVRLHSWEGNPDYAVGTRIPTPLGQLFAPLADTGRAAA